jgi:hypothetical protein
MTIEQILNMRFDDDKIYPELTPMLNPTGMVRILRNRAGDIYKFACLDSFEWEVSLYIEELERRLAEK